jgi:methyl-accepting chemotaxis protein
MDAPAGTTQTHSLNRDIGATMAEILQSVRQVNEIVAEITAASEEQSIGIEQVGQTIVQMDEATQLCRMNSQFTSFNLAALKSRTVG